MRIVLDIETKPFNDLFRLSKTDKVRLLHAPEPLVACVYLIETRRYKFYEANAFDELAELIIKADEVITYNGNSFDFLVIMRHLKLHKSALLKGKNSDLLKPVSKKAGFRVSLHILSKLNLGEGKKVKGEELCTASVEHLKEGCKSDVSQTYRLYKLWKANTLKIPAQESDRWGKWRYLHGSKSNHGHFAPFYFDHINPNYANAFTASELESIYYQALSTKHLPFGLDFISSGIPKNKNYLERAFIILTTQGNGYFPIRDSSGAVLFPHSGTHQFRITGWEYIAGIETGILKNHDIISSYSFYESKFYGDDLKSIMGTYPDAKFDPSNLFDENGYSKKTARASSRKMVTYYVAAAASLKGYARSLLMHRHCAVNPMI